MALEKGGAREKATYAVLYINCAKNSNCHRPAHQHCN